MVIWTSSLKLDSEIFKGVEADASFTHSNKLVQSSIYIYTKAIHYLLNFFYDPNRAQKAFDIALKLSESEFGNA
jgi:hypothetical protein